MPADPPPATDLASLERFVVDNDDRLAPAERVGRFNLFGAPGIARREVRPAELRGVGGE